MFKLDLENPEEPEIKFQHPLITEKAKEFEENIYFCCTDQCQAFDCVDHYYGKFSKRWEYQNTWPASWEICMQIKKQQLEPDMEQWTGS